MTPSKTNKQKIANYVPLSERNGKLRFGLTNDYLFKVVFQNDEEILKLLLAALLGIDKDAISKITVTNPIIPGDSAADKTIVLDIRVIVNDSRTINLEMQVLGYANWKKRSIYYLCMMYTDLKQGEIYDDVKPVHQIGILDFDLKGIKPAFFSSYMLMNVKNHEIYSSDLTLSVLNLKHIDMATDEDRERKLDIWAKLFKAETWEELKMLANEYEFVNNIADSIYAMTEDERIREQCRLREERSEEERRVLDSFARTKVELSQAQGQLYQTQSELETRKIELSQTQNKLSQAQFELTTNKSELKARKAELEKQTTLLAEKDARIAELEAMLAEKK